jgi:hypothetical protein
MYSFVELEAGWSTIEERQLAEHCDPYILAYSY